MKIVFCIFSYETDKKLVKLAVEAIERLKKLYPERELLTAIVNDGNAPIPDEDMPPVDIVKTTTWQRGFNLSSTENIFGQAEIYKNLVSETGADVLVKLDSDTLISRLDFLSEFEGDHSAGMWGTTSNTFFAVYGHAYALSARMVLSINELLADESIAARVKATTGIAIAEDRIFTRLAEMAAARGMAGRVKSEFLHKEKVQEILNGENALPMFVLDYNQYDIPQRRYTECFAVTFKRRGKTDDIVAEALEGMTAFWEVLKDAPRFKTAEETRTAQEAARRTEAETAVPAE